MSEVIFPNAGSAGGVGLSTRAICVACRSRRRLLGRQHSVAQALPGWAVECAWAIRWVLAVVTRKWIGAVCGSKARAYLDWLGCSYSGVRT